MHIIDKYLQELHKKKRIVGEMYIPVDGKLYVGVAENGAYYIPGGGAHKNESPLQAAVRETLEEIGVKVKNIKELYKPCVIKDGMEKLYPFIGEFDGFDASKWGDGPEGKFRRALVPMMEIITNEETIMRHGTNDERTDHVIKMLRKIIGEN